MNRTRPERERDNRSDNRLTVTAEKPNGNTSEAGWRRGYAADCKSVKTGSIPVPASKSPIRALILLRFFLIERFDPP